jgi:hypothetical protein
MTIEKTTVVLVARLYGSLFRYRPSPTEQIIQSYSGIIRATIGPPEIGTERWVRDTEHELGIAGHEYDCRACERERAERYTVNGVVWAPGSAMDQHAPTFARMIRDTIDNGHSR